MSRLVGMVLALLLGLSVAPVPAARALPLDEPHLEALISLAEPIERCIGNNDHIPFFPGAFQGCFDWHSAVHADLALRIVARHTDQGRYRGIADEISTPEALAEEQRLIRQGWLSAELPYGYAWLLLLDREAEREHIHAAALDVVGPLRAWLRGRLDDPRHVTATRYASSTFPAYAIHRWYSHFEPQRGRRFAQQAVPRLLAQREVACGQALAGRGFLDPCASLLLALTQLSRDVAVADDVLAGMAQVVAARRPVRASRMRTIFEAGLNFSRAWALYAAADALRDQALVDRGDVLFTAQLEQPELWSTQASYAAYSHWVAQFGVYALDLRSEVDGISPLPSPPPEASPGWAGPWQVAPSVWAY